MAAPIKRGLSVTEAQHVATLEKKHGKACLARYLEWVADEETNMQTSIQIDFLFDIIVYCAEKGFKWEDICFLVDLSNEILLYSIGKSLTEVLSFFKERTSNLPNEMGERHYKFYMEYMFETFLKHYKLFQYVFTHERALLHPKVTKEVETVRELSPLKDGNALPIWEYKQQYKAAEEREEKYLKQKEFEKEKLVKDIEEKKAKVMQSALSEPLTKETMEDIIKSVLEAQITGVKDKLVFKISEVMEDLELKLEKTSIPRPQALGAPPKINLKPKTPVPSAQVKTVKETEKTERKGSGSSTRSNKNKNSKS